jgi:hypothetical protein
MIRVSLYLLKLTTSVGVTAAKINVSTVPGNMDNPLNLI